MAQAVDGKLTEKEERNNKKEQFPVAMYDELHKIMQLLTQNREAARNGLAAIDRKLNWFGGNIKAEVLTGMNTLIQNHTEQEWKDQDEYRVRQNRPEIPYHLGGGPKLEKPSTRSSS